MVNSILPNSILRLIKSHSFQLPKLTVSKRFIQFVNHDNCDYLTITHLAGIHYFDMPGGFRFIFLCSLSSIPAQFDFHPVMYAAYSHLKFNCCHSAESFYSGSCFFPFFARGRRSRFIPGKILAYESTFIC